MGWPLRGITSSRAVCISCLIRAACVWTSVFQGMGAMSSSRSCSAGVMNYPNSRCFFAELEVLFGSHKPLIWSVGEVQWNWANLVTLTDVALHSWPTAKLTAERWEFQLHCTASSKLNLQFLTETLQVRTGVNTLVGTNQDKKSPGTHLGLTLWVSSLWSFNSSRFHCIIRPQGSYLQFASFMRW